MRSGGIIGVAFSLLGLGAIAGILVAAPVTQPAVTKPTTKPATRPARAAVPPQTVESAVAALTAEANERFVPDTRLQITLVRPHAAVRRVPPSEAHKVLAAMKGKLTGKPLQDVYIRYHLMDVVNRALAGAQEPFTPDLMALAPLIPDDIEIELKPWWAYDPPEIGNRYRQIIDSVAVHIGFPPFRRRVDAPESFQYMDGAARAKAEALYAEAKSLEGKFKSTMSHENHVYNYKVIWMNWLIRQYRGELLYAMVAQGDKNALDMIADAVSNAAAKDPARAADLVSFLNAAYFNGYMGKYDEAVLKRVGSKLRAAAAASERAATAAAAKGQTVRGPKSLGPTMSTGWINTGGRWRQVPESLFTIVFGIENNRVPQPIPAEKMERPEVSFLPPDKLSSNWEPASGRHRAEAATRPTTVPTTGPTTGPATQPTIRPQDVTLDLIDAAIAKAIPALERLRAPDVDLNWCSYVAKRLPANYWYTDYTLPGQGALTTWAMLASGESVKDPWFQRRVGWVQAYDSPTTYDRAMRLMFLSNVRYQGMDPWLKRDAAWLIDTMTTQGNWDARNVGVRSAGYGDNANGQYAVLGLWAADQAGIEIPENVWQKVDSYWRQAQRPPGSPGDGAWAVISSAALKKGANLNDFTNRVSAPMTAGGVLSLHISEMYLHGPKRVDVGQTLSPELTRGVQWLDDHFSMDELDGDQDFYYYMWTIQNVGQATGFRTFNNVDWFREVTARLLNAQQENGTWKGPKGEHVSTSFALLYLSRARGPLAISKVRFDPTAAAPGAKPSSRKPSARDMAKANAWNNRPNDLFNFVNDVSRQVEVPTTWQIADLDQPVYELIESPIMYLATDKAFKLPPEQVQRLKEYVDAGGMLVCAPEGRNLSAALTSMKALATEVMSGMEPRIYKDNSHPFFTLNGKIKTPIPTYIYGSVTRPKVVIIEKDISRDLQANNPKERESFTFLMNLYLYATGKEPAKPRIVTNYLIQKATAPKTKLAVARIKTGGSEAEPMAIPQLKAFMADRHDVDLQVSEVQPQDLVGSTTKVAFLTVTPETTITPEQGDALRQWTEAGGTLWVDALSGSGKALDQLEGVLGALKAPTSELTPMNEHAIMTGIGIHKGYDATDGKPLRLYRNERNDRVALTAKRIGDRPAILVCRGDIMTGVAGMNHWGIAGFSASASRELVANSLLQFLAPPPATRPATAPTTVPATKPATQSAK